MTFVYFLSLRNEATKTQELDLSRRKAIKAFLSTVPRMSRALVLTPETARDDFNYHGPGPSLSLQLYFEELTDLEVAVAANAALSQLQRSEMLGCFAEELIDQQAFYQRSFLIDDPSMREGSAVLPCSYVVHYPGPAKDTNAWLTHYITHHPPIMRRFPQIREIEILSRVDWCGGLPWPRANHMQRNRIMFDSPTALTAALQSPVRLEMRTDFATFPPYEGGNFHYPMATEEVLPNT